MTGEPDHRRELIEAIEAERREIAKDLHDECGQLLTGLKVQLDLGTPEAVERAKGIAEELMARLRAVALDLRPAALEDLGLVPALRGLIERFTDRTGIRVTFAQSQADARYAPQVELVAYRIVQEALTNVARHAETAEANVSVATSDGSLTVCIEDQGTGTTRGPSTGLAGMAERVTAVGGTLTIESTPGRGTVVTAVLPIGARS